MKFIAKAIAIVSPILLWILLYEKIPFSIDIPFSRLTLSELEGKILKLIAAINTGIMVHRTEFMALAYAFVGLVVFCFILLLIRTKRSAIKPSNEYTFEASDERTAEALAKRTSLTEFIASAIAFCSSVVFGFIQLVIRTIRSAIKTSSERPFEESDERIVEESDQRNVEVLAKHTVASSVDLTSVMESLARLSEAIRGGRINKPSVDLIIREAYLRQIREAYLRQISGENVNFKSTLESMNDW